MSNADKSPAEILARVLATRGLGGTAFPPAGAWPIVVDNLPNLPQVVCVYDVPGMLGGRLQTDGRVLEKPGFQIRIAAQDHPTGYAKARAYKQALDAILKVDVFDDGSVILHAAHRSGTIIRMGVERDGVRHHFAINGTLTIYGV